MNSSQNIFAYGDSKISILPEGIQKAAWPVDYDDVLPVGTQEVGYTTTDGETFTRTAELTDIDANQQAKVRQIASNGSATLEFTALEDNEVTRWLYNATAATPGTSYTDVDNFAQTIARTIVWDTSDTQDGFVKHKRYVFEANIAPNGGITYSRGNTAQRSFIATALGAYREITEQPAVS